MPCSRTASSLWRNHHRSPYASLAISLVIDAAVPAQICNGGRHIPSHLSSRKCHNFGGMWLDGCPTTILYTSWHDILMIVFHNGFHFCALECNYRMGVHSQIKGIYCFTQGGKLCVMYETGVEIRIYSNCYLLGLTVYKRSWQIEGLSCTLLDWQRCVPPEHIARLCGEQAVRGRRCGHMVLEFRVRNRFIYDNIKHCVTSHELIKNTAINKARTNTLRFLVQSLKYLYPHTTSGQTWIWSHSLGFWPDTVNN